MCLILVQQQRELDIALDLLEAWRAWRRGLVEEQRKEAPVLEEYERHGVVGQP